MESKITIEIHEDGQPYLMIRYVNSSDLRDQVLGRFITSTGAYLDENKAKPVPLSLSVLEPNAKGCLALIEPQAYYPPDK